MDISVAVGASGSALWCLY